MASTPPAPGPAAPRPAWWIATGFGSGRLRPAPGTWGSLAALLVWAFVFRVLRDHPAPVLVLGLAAPLLMTGLGIWASGRVVVETGLEDPGFIVADEWAGQWIALAPLLFSPALASPTWGAWMFHLVAPFLLFRLFDIWKPGPVDAAQSLPGGWGVMLDDVVAGLFAALLTALLEGWVWPRI